MAQDPNRSKVDWRAPHALPLRQLAIQRRTFRFPEWYIDCLKSQARLVFDAQQHVDASGREIAVDQCALQLALGQAPCDHRREHAGSRSPDAEENTTVLRHPACVSVPID